MQHTRWPFVFIKLESQRAAKVTPSHGGSSLGLPEHVITDRQGRVEILMTSMISCHVPIIEHIPMFLVYILQAPVLWSDRPTLLWLFKAHLLSTNYCLKWNTAPVPIFFFFFYNEGLLYMHTWCSNLVAFSSHIPLKKYKFSNEEMKILSKSAHPWDMHWSASL